MEKQVVGRFLLGAGLGGLVGTGVLALVSVSFPPPHPAGPAPEVKAGQELPVAPEPEAAPEVPPAAAEADAETPVPEAAPEAPKAADPVKLPQPAAPETAAPEATPAAPADASGEDEAAPTAPEAGYTPAFDLTELPDLSTGPEAATVPDPALAAALEAALEGGDVPATPAQPAAPEASPADDPVAPAANPAAAPDIAGVPGAADETAPPNTLADQPAAPDTPAGPEAPANADATARAATPEAPRPEALAEEDAPATAKAPEPPPLSAEEEMLLAQIAADQLLEESAPPADAPLLPKDDGFVILDEVPPVPEQPAPDAAPAPEQADAGAAPAAETDTPVAPTRIATPDGSSTLPGSGTVSGEARGGAGVETSRLPRIGDSAPADQPDTGVVSEADAGLPLTAFARPFENPAEKPRFAVILIDDGAPDLDRAALADLPFPVSFAIDPELPEAAKIAGLYRAAGQEVIMLASGLPKGAVASDLAVAFDAMSRTLPESVAVMDAPGRGFQGDRPLSSLIVPEVNAQGRGLITWNVGLNAADQVAKREDVPSAVIFRDLDAEGEEAPVIRRYLDRAAFKAMQDGTVIVAGRAGHAATLSALLEWAVEGRAASVELAPVTAMLSID